LDNSPPGFGNLISLVTAGPGTIFLAGPVHYAGSTTIQSGSTLQIGGAGQLGVGGSYAGGITNNGTLEYSSSVAAQTLSGPISGTGALVKDTSNSVLTLTGANTYTGATSINSGQLLLSGSIGSATIPSGAINIGPAGFLLVNPGGSIDIGPASITNGGKFNNGGVIVAGALSNLAGASMSNSVGGTLTADVDSLALSSSIENFGSWNGTANNAAGNIINHGLADGSIINGTWIGGANSTGSTFSSDGIQNNGTWTGTANVSGGHIFNFGSWSGTANVSGGVLQNFPQWLWSGTANVSGGVLENDGSWTGPGNVSGGGLTNVGSWSGAASVSGGGLTNLGTWNGAASVSGGGLTNLGTWNGAAGVSGGGLTNLGTWNGAAGVSGGALLLGSGGTWNGNAKITGGELNNYGSWNGAIVNTSGTFTNEASGIVTGNLTNASGGSVFAQGAIFGEIQNAGVFRFTGDLVSGGDFSNSGTVQMAVIQPSTRLTMTFPSVSPGLPGATYTFFNNGVLDLRNPYTVATNSVINGNYVGGANSAIVLNVSGVGGNTGQANHLEVTGSVNGASPVVVVPFNGALALFSNPVPIITVMGDPPPFVLVPSVPSLAGYNIQELSPGQFYLSSYLNAAPVGSIAAGLQSAVESASAGFFLGLSSVFFDSAPPPSPGTAPNGAKIELAIGESASPPFLGAPPNITPNQVSAGVWTRGASGMDSEHTDVTDSLGSASSTLKIQTHFDGFQVGSDLGMFNIQNSGWNLHGGVTGGEYDVSVGDNTGVASGSYAVPFLGLYAAAVGHGFFGDVMVRHDFWQGNVTSSAAGLMNSRLNGGANAVTAEAGYRYYFQNGVFATPSVGFSYTNATFDNLNLLQNTFSPPNVNFGNVRSELGRVGLTVADTFRTAYWALTPNVTGSIWHEFAGEIPTAFTYGAFADNVLASRVGTFGQIGVGLLAQPLQNLNWTAFVRADYRTGSNIYGGTITAGFRYQF
jgi:autotransporter-associated beta strand protein